MMRRQMSDACSNSPSNSGPLAAVSPEPEMSFPGRWVAVKGAEVLVAASSPTRVVDWLERHGQSADSMFRVPEDELAFSGLAPL